MNPVNYKYTTKEIAYERIMDDGTILRIKTPMICTTTIDNNGKKIGPVLPSPLRGFINKIEGKGKKGGSLGTQKTVADKIIKFLNFLVKESRLGNEDFSSFREKGTFGLTRKHGALFLNSLTDKRVSYQTFEVYDWVLNKFYNYLSTKRLIEENILYVYTDDRQKNWLSIFEDLEDVDLSKPTVQTAKKNRPKLKDFGKHRYSLIVRLLTIARAKAPEIAFMLCLMIFGGLRSGEVVNVRKEDINAVLRESLSVKIRDNRETLFAHLKDTQSCAPKRLNYLKGELATQTILDLPILWEIYEEHEKWLAKLRKDKIVTNPDVYFPNSLGTQISGRSLDKKFDKVWKVFIHGDKSTNFPSLVGHPAYDKVAFSYWGTHICRGLFTNMLIDMRFSVTQIAIARGDRDIRSMMEYIDQLIAEEGLLLAVEELKKTPLEEASKELNNVPVQEIGIIPRALLQTYWKEGVLERENLAR